MKANAPLYSLNAGEISKIALARVDISKMRMAAEVQLNWSPYVVGPMTLRAGLLMVGETLSDQPTKMIDFVYAKDDTSLIELTPGEMRIWINEVLLTRPQVATQIRDPYFTNTGINAGVWDTTNTTAGATVVVAKDSGDDFGSATFTCTPVGGLTQVQQTVTVAPADQGVEHGIRVVVTNGPVTFRAGSSAGLFDVVSQKVLDTGTYSLSCFPTGNFVIQIESIDAWNKIVTQCSIEAPGPVIIPTTWAESDLGKVRWVQSLDEVFIACAGQQQRVIQRSGTRPAARGWAVVLFKSNDGPFNSLPTISGATLTPSVYYGNGTLTSSLPLFQKGHVGGLFRMFCSGQLNNCLLGGQGAFSDPLRVSGNSKNDRLVLGTVSGTWSGTLTVQRSFVGPNESFTTNTSNGGTALITSNGDISYDDSAGGTTTQFFGTTVWIRIGFAGAGDYGSGAANITFGNYLYTGAVTGQGGQYAVVRVTGYTSPTQVDIEAITSPESLALGMVTPIPSISGATNWAESQWSDVAGWPTSVCIHEGRLCWFGGAQAWLSASDNYDNFADINFNGTSTGDGGAIIETLGSGPGDNIPWGMSLSRLLIGREQSIMSARSSNFDQPLTPSAIVIRDCSDQGAERLPAIKVGKRGIFVQQSGFRVYELSFASQEQDYDDKDLTRLNQDIGSKGFVAIHHSTQPEKTVWLPRGDGQCAALLYDVKDEVETWWRIQTLGLIEDVVVLPQDGFEDLVYFVINRTIDGQTKRFIEKIALRANCVGGSINQQLDCASTFQLALGTASVNVPQLPNTLVNVWADGVDLGTTTSDALGNVNMPDGNNHLNIVVGLGGAMVSANSTTLTGVLAVGSQYEGYPCEVFADIAGTGRVKHIGAVTVTNGTVTLPSGKQAYIIVACLGYIAPFVSTKLAYGAQMGSALNMKKRIDHLGLVFYDTHCQGLTYGQRIDVMDPMPLYEADQETPDNTVWDEYDEPVIELPGEWDSDARLYLLAQAPRPATVGAVVMSLKTDEK